MAKRRRKSKKDKLKEELAKYPQASDVLYEVTKLDRLTKGTKEYDSQHSVAVRSVKTYNDFFGNGAISLSKARYLQQVMNFNKKQLAEEKKKELQNAGKDIGAKS